MIEQSFTEKGWPGASRIVATGGKLSGAARALAGTLERISDGEAHAAVKDSMFVLAEVKPHADPVSWVQLALVGVQILVAIFSTLFTKRYYDGMVGRGDQTLETQRADVLLKHQVDNERLGGKVRSTCESLREAAVDGTRNDPKIQIAKRTANAHERLDRSEKELRELQEAFRGFREEMTLRSHIEFLIVAIGQYKAATHSGDAHAERVRVCSEIGAGILKLCDAWKRSAEARLEGLRPGTG